MSTTPMANSSLNYSPVVSADDDPLFEIVNGERIALPPMSAYSSVIATDLVIRLGIYDHPRKLGRPVVEALFKLEGVEGRNRRPDLAFVSFERWPQDKPIPPKDNAWPVTPDLAVEIVSPSDYADDLMEKTVEYFQAGVRQVWVVYPRFALTQLFRSPTEIQVFGREDVLTAEDLFPHFSLPLNELFQA